jgi:hypothetical protein
VGFDLYAPETYTKLVASFSKYRRDKDTHSARGQNMRRSPTVPSGIRSEVPHRFLIALLSDATSSFPTHPGETLLRHGKRATSALGKMIPVAQSRMEHSSRVGPFQRALAAPARFTAMDEAREFQQRIEVLGHLREDQTTAVLLHQAATRTQRP